jgi:ABC-2 type transport system permease protein
MAVGQGAIFLALAPTIGIRLTLIGVAVTLFMMFLVAFALSALGVCIAWSMTSSQGFHAIMNLFLMPMWLLSGALFPTEGAVSLLRWVMWANPLTYGMAGLRHALYWQTNLTNAGPSAAVCIAVTTVFAAVMFLLAAVIVRKSRADVMQ